jgi:hypothetical protein
MITNKSWNSSGKADSCDSVARIVTELRQRFQLFQIKANDEILCIISERLNRPEKNLTTNLNRQQEKIMMNRHVNAISGHLSLKLPQRLSFKLLDRIPRSPHPGRGPIRPGNLRRSKASFLRWRI